MNGTGSSMSERTKREYLQMLQMRREKFFRPPYRMRASVPQELKRAVEDAAQSLKWTRSKQLGDEPWTDCLRREAAASAAIEDETDPERVQRHAGALEQMTVTEPHQKRLLTMHAGLMAGQDHAQPGRYRNVNVRVGQHTGAPYPAVPKLMAPLFEYLRNKEEPAVLRAAYGHLQFETIHPFADGNGRTGRALISQQLKFPLPLSEWILENRQQYYRMLGDGNWDRYLQWFLTGLTKKAREYCT